MRDPNKKHVFQVVETSTKNGIERYTIMMTDAEMTRFLKGRYDSEGYIPGVGGDKRYSIVAWYITY